MLRYISHIIYYQWRSFYMSSEVIVTTPLCVKGKWVACTAIIDLTQTITLGTSHSKVSVLHWTVTLSKTSCGGQVQFASVSGFPSLMGMGPLWNFLDAAPVIPPVSRIVRWVGFVVSDKISQLTLRYLLKHKCFIEKTVHNIATRFPLYLL